MKARVLAWGALLVVGCRPGAVTEPGDAQASPQASAQPAPFTTPLIASFSGSGEGGPPPVPLRADEALEPEAMGKDGPGYTIAAVVRLPDAPAVPTGPAVNTAAIDALRKQNEPRFVIDLTATHMRMQVASGGFLLARDAELRARVDRYGHVFVTPDLATYRVLAPGALRALFGERRVDVSPMSPVEVSPGPEGMRLGYRTRRVDVRGRAGKAVFEVARVADLGDGGALVTRALLDWMNAPPQTVVVGPDELPLHAELAWPSRGAVFFDVTGVTKRPDLSFMSFAVPPSSATFTTGPLPTTAGELRVDAKELAGIHTGPTDVGADVPKTGSLTLANPHDTPRFAWLEGVPVAWVGADGRVDLPALPRGRYQLAWRSFLDDAAEGPNTVIVPTLAGDGGR